MLKRRMMAKKGRAVVNTNRDSRESETKPQTPSKLVLEKKEEEQETIWLALDWEYLKTFFKHLKR